MLKLEFYKLFCKKKILIVLLVGIAAEIFLSMQSRSVMFEGFNPKVYRYYMEELQGEYTVEKQTWIEQEYERLQNLISDEEMYEAQYKRNEIGAEAYRKVSGDIKTAKNRIRTVEYIVEKSGYYSGVDGTPEYFYDIGIKDYIENMKMDVIMLVILIIMIAPVFTEDHSCGTVPMIRSSKYGTGRLYYNRLTVVLTISAGIGFLFPVLEFVTKYVKFDLGNLNADIRSLMVMENSNLDMSIIQYLFLTMATRAFFAVVFGVFVMWVAVLSHRNIVTYVVTLGAVYIPYFLYSYMNRGMQDLMLCKGLGGFDNFKEYHVMAGIPDAWFGGVVYGMLAGGVIWSCGRYVGERRR